MKQQAIQYVALDVHQATVVVSVRDEQGSLVMRATVATEAKPSSGSYAASERGARGLRRRDTGRS